MNKMEEQASEFLRRKDWAKGVEVYNQLLNKQANKQQVISCLFGRSECFSELGQFEAVVSDCRRIIALLIGENEDSNSSIAYRRLIHALFSMRRFSGLLFCFLHSTTIIFDVFFYRSGIGDSRMGGAKEFSKPKLSGSQEVLTRIACIIPKH